MRVPGNHVENMTSLNRSDAVEHCSESRNESTERWNGLTPTRFGPVALTSIGLGQALRQAQGLLQQRAVSPVEPAAPPPLHK
jgi:hypothetical protein